MTTDETRTAEAARTAPSESIPILLLSKDEDVLRGLLENPSLDETQVCLLLGRKDLPAALLEEIAKRKKWCASYRVRCALAGHPHTARLTAIRMLRDLHLMDLVKISLLSTSSGELRRLAEERVLTQLPQLPLGQKLMLARRGPARVAGELIVHGPIQVTRIALDNPFLTEAQLLKPLARESLPARTLTLIANHEKWSTLVNVRVALLRHPNAPLDRVLAFVPDLPRRDIEDLLGLTSLPSGARAHLQSELARRDQR
jgi:hypothetical protein